MIGLPSIRECEQRLQALERAPAPVAELAQALAVGRALLRHLRDFGTPPAQEQTLKQRAQSLSPVTRGTPMHLVRRPALDLPAPRPAQLPPEAVAQISRAGRREVAGAAPPPPTARPRKPADWRDVNEVAELLGLQPASVWKMQTTGQLAPSRTFRGRAHWTLAEVEACRARRAEAKTVPPGQIGTAELCELLGRNRSWVWQASYKGSFPKPAGHIDGGENVWDRTAVERWIEQNPLRKLAARAAPCEPVPAGYVTRVDLSLAIDRTDAWIYGAQASSGFPRPTLKHGQHNLWSEARVREWIAQQPLRTGKSAPKKFGAWDERTAMPAQRSAQ